MNKKLIGTVAVLCLALSLGLSGCEMFAPPPRPSIVILSPPPSTPLQEGAVVTIRSTATDVNGITHVELAVDGTVVRADAPPRPQNSFSVAQTWRAAAGEHTLSVRAFNNSGATSDPATVQVAVVVTANVAAAPAITPSKAPTLGAKSPGAICTDNEVFVRDVTIPDGTVLSVQQPFDKVWRVQNTGTCTWDTGYKFVLLSGQVMASTSVSVPTTAPGALADLLVPMTAPLTPGNFDSVWRLRNPAGVLFGESLNVSIRVVTSPTPATCSGTPTIEFFDAVPTTITAGQSATLNWGFVSNAQSASIDNGIDGIATPGSIAVSPTGTASYTLTATCGAITRTARVTITVIPAPTRPTATSTTIPPTPTGTATPVGRP